MDSRTQYNKETQATERPIKREYDIRGKNYIVKSVYVGEKDIKSALLNLAEKKAIKDMGLDSSFDTKTA